MPPTATDLRSVVSTTVLRALCGLLRRRTTSRCRPSTIRSTLPPRTDSQHTGGSRGKCRATIIDIIKVCTDPNITLPVYHAADLSRLPPVDASHCNVAAILAELQQLPAEVRSFQQVSDQLAVLLRKCWSRERSRRSVCHVMLQSFHRYLLPHQAACLRPVLQQPVALQFSPDTRPFV